MVNFIFYFIFYFKKLKNFFLAYVRTLRDDLPKKKVTETLNQMCKDQKKKLEKSISKKASEDEVNTDGISHHVNVDENNNESSESSECSNDDEENDLHDDSSEESQDEHESVSETNESDQEY